MTAQEKRAKVVSLYKSRVGKNQYTQGADRNCFWGKPSGTNPGYSDCSSSVRAVYKNVLGVDIGSNTDAQVRSRRGTVVDTTTGLYPNEENLRPGDCLYFKGNSNHTEGVGHVEMYIGNGKCAGHGSGMGPKVHNMRNYCRGRGAAKHYYKAIRWILDDSDGENDPAGAPADGKAAVIITGASVYVRTGPGKENTALGIVHKGDVLEKTGADTADWFGVKYNGQPAFVSAKYCEPKG